MAHDTPPTASLTTAEMAMLAEVTGIIPAAVAPSAPEEPWPPDLPPVAESGALALGGSPSEDQIADDVLGKLYYDYRWAADLRRWIVRDGVRWIPAPQGVAPFVTACAAATPVNRKLDDPTTRRRAVRNGHADQGMIRRDDIQADGLARQMKTLAAQGRIAALMAREAGELSMEVRAAELDAEPTVLWAGGVPFDLARSADGPAWARGDYLYDDYFQEDEPYPLTWPHLLGSPYCPDAGVPTPLWDKLTAAIFPDPAEREHALDALSHGLHGYPASAAILARSATGLGKSLIASLLTDLLGDYAGQVAAPTLFGRTGSSQFAHDEMGGARFVVMSEGSRSDFAATETFKAVVSPDPTANARGRLERRRRLVPARHTLFLTVNPAADLDYSDPAVVRRLVPLGFCGDRREIEEISRRIGTDRAESYASWQAEAPGVLAQLIMRCARVLDDRDLGTRSDLPESIASRFGDVVAEASPFGRWMDERTSQGGPTATGDLLEDYRRWCEVERLTPLNSTWFGRALASAGVERAKLDRDTRGWQLALR